MKKILLSACLALGISAGVHANSSTWVNLTTCTFYVSTQGGYITVPPGTIFYASPANISNPAAPPSGTFSGAKVDLSPSFPNQVYVNTGGPTFVNSASVGVFPACNGGVAYNVSWNVGAPPAGDIVALFY